MKRASFSLIVVIFVAVLLSACDPNFFFNVNAVKTPEVNTTESESKISSTPTPDYYVVKEGDTLWGISKKTGTDFQTLILLNELKDPDRLRPGQRLLITGTVNIVGTPLPTVTPTPIHCLYGCINPPKGCEIKGFQTKVDGLKLYALPEDDIYNLRRAEVWFCREEDAVRLGWKHWTPKGPEGKE